MSSEEKSTSLVNEKRNENAEVDNDNGDDGNNRPMDIRRRRRRENHRKGMKLVIQASNISNLALTCLRGNLASYHAYSNSLKLAQK